MVHLCICDPTIKKKHLLFSLTTTVTDGSNALISVVMSFSQAPSLLKPWARRVTFLMDLARFARKRRQLSFCLLGRSKAVRTQEVIAESGRKTR